MTVRVWDGPRSALVANGPAAAAATAASPRTTCSYQDRSGALLPNSPKLKFNIGATANFPLKDDVEGTFILNYQHQSSVNFDLLGNPLTVQEGYGVVNTSLGANIGRLKRRSSSTIRSTSPMRPAFPTALGPMAVARRTIFT